MHIVYVTTRFVDGMGPTSGLPKYLLRVSLALITMGHKVTIVTCSNRTVDYDFLNINVRCVRIPRIIKYDSQEKDTLAECYVKGEYINKAIHSLYEDENIDIIQYTSLCGLGYWHDIDVPAVMRLSSYAKLWPIKGREIAQSTYANMERKAAKKCDAIFGPSRYVADHFKKDISCDVDVIETPFVMETPNENIEIYRRLFEGKKYILFYGTLTEYKGLNVISNITNKLLCKYDDLYLGIIGNGNIEYIRKITECAGDEKNRIIYNPAIGFEMLKPIISNAIAVILPSIAENFSNACVESMALGQIVIGTEGRSFEQLIDDGISGLLCKPGDGNSLLDAIDRAINLSTEERERISINAVKRIDKLKPEYVVDELLSYYERVIENRCMEKKKS